MTAIDYFNPFEPTKDLRLGMAPIFGSKSCAFMRNGARLFSDNEKMNDPLILNGGLAFIADIQPEGDDEHIIFGTKSLANSCIIIYFNADGIKN